jgi:C1A family cysteine protease
MPVSDPSSCTNCNLQSSNPSYSTGLGSNTLLNVAPPRKRYNPATQYETSANTSTSQSIEQVIKVATQQASAGGDKKETEQKKKKDRNVQTLEEIKKLINVNDDSISFKDDGKTQTKKSFQLQRVALQGLKKDQPVALKSRALSGVKAVEAAQAKVEDKKKNKTYRKIKTVGTLLASSPEFQAKFNALVQAKPQLKEIEIEDVQVPKQFKGQEIWKEFFIPVRDQGLCGSCWAFSSTFVLSARLAIMSNGRYKYIFAPAKLIFCNFATTTNQSISENNSETDEIRLRLQNKFPFDRKIEGIGEKEKLAYGCEGETLINTYQFLFRYGVPENSCFNYGDEEDPNTVVNLKIKSILNNECSDFTSVTFDKCPSDDSYLVSHRVGGYYYVPGTKSFNNKVVDGSEYTLRKEIFKFGPVTTGMMCYNDFMEWDGKGIYKYDGKSEKVGGHAVVIVGWGEEGNKKFWWVRNSWGSDWGYDGYFKIIRGENHCEIEENCFVGFPNIPSLSRYLDHPLLFQQEDFATKYLWGTYDSGYKKTIYENLALGKISKKDIKFENLYDIQFFPDFSQFQAGNYDDFFKNKEYFSCDDNIIDYEYEKINNILDYNSFKEDCQYKNKKKNIKEQKNFVNLKIIILIILIFIFFIF